MAFPWSLLILPRKAIICATFEARLIVWMMETSFVRVISCIRPMFLLLVTIVATTPIVTVVIKILSIASVTAV